MTDYHFETSVLRGQMGQELGNNIEQMAYVLSEALSMVAADDVIEAGELSDEADPELVAFNLRKIADAIADGTLS